MKKAFYCTRPGLPSASPVYRHLLGLSSALALWLGVSLWTAHAQPQFAIIKPGPAGTLDIFASGYGPGGLPRYHPQVTAYFCGAATMEMILDCQAVRSQNQYVDIMLRANGANPDPGPAVVDGPPQHCNPPFWCWPPVTFNLVNGVSQVVGGAQSFLYGLCHGLNSFRGFTYFNPWAPPGVGTPLDELQAGLTLMDSPANAAGPHNYAPYNIASRAIANRTIVDCLALVGMPAAVTVQSGGHWFCVIGARVSLVPSGPDQPFTILGFYVHDPWTGYGKQFPVLIPKTHKPYLGVGANKYLTYAVNPHRPLNEDDWNYQFNLSPGGPPLPLYGAGIGYKFDVEPIGPVILDTGNNGEYTSVPDPSPILTNAPLTAAEALAYATNAIAQDSFLASQAGFTNGTWDLANASIVQYPADGPGQGDWLIAYEGPGGTNDVTGVVMIDMETGDLDEATWMNPDDAVASMTLADVQTMETDEFAGNFISDNEPEPQLSIQLTGTNTVVLAWPSSPLFNYSVQQLPSLGSTNWMTLTNVPTVVGDNNQIVLPILSSQAFFRLSSQ